MIYVVAALLMVVNTAWLGLVLLRLPGVWLMVLSACLAAWWQADEGMFSLVTLGVVLFLAILGEVLEFLAGVVGSKRAGGTRWGAAGAVLGSIAGGLAGTFLLPVAVLGSVIGACAGACLGAVGMELAVGRRIDAAVRSGRGAGVGTFGGILAKLGTGVAVWVIIAVAAFWP